MQEWQTHIDDILADPGVTVVVGQIDVGKTTFCARLANLALEAEIPTAIVDGDMGQSEIGPPTTVGMALVESPIRSMGDLHPKALHFIGSTSPVGHFLPSAVGIKRLVDKAESLGRRLIIVDTTGLVSGTMGREFKTHKIELLRPGHIAAFQKSGEAEHFLRFFDTWEDLTIHRLPISPEARSKPQALRTQRRAVRFHEYFLDGRTHEISLDTAATSGTWLRTGRPLEPRYLNFAENLLGTPIHYGERSDSGVYLVTESDASNALKSKEVELQDEFRARSVTAVPATKYTNLITGLMDSHLNLLALGIIRGINFRAQIVSLHTPLRSIAPVKSIRFGVLKLRPDGTEIGRLRPGDV